MCSKMRLGLQLRCQAEAIAQGFHPDLGTRLMTHYLDEMLYDQEVSDVVFEYWFWYNVYAFANNFDELTDNRLHQVYTEVHNAVTNYLKYVKNTSEEELLAR